MKIAIIGAMEQEVALLKEQLNNRQTIEKAKCVFHTGQIHGVDVVLLQSGIGKVAAAIGTTLLIENFAPDKIINTGSAGGFQTNLNVGDIVISTEVRHHDVDVTAFGYKIGQMAQQPESFMADAELISLTKQALTDKTDTPDIANKQDVKVMHGLICTGDAFICSTEQQSKIRQNFPQVLAVEMEAAAIAQTCHQFNVPFVVVRAISDVADKESPMSFEEFLPLAAQSSSDMVINILKIINKAYS